jgi:hypothetical protein
VVSFADKGGSGDGRRAFVIERKEAAVPKWVLLLAENKAVWVHFYKKLGLDAGDLGWAGVPVAWRLPRRGGWFGPRGEGGFGCCLVASLAYCCSFSFFCQVASGLMARLKYLEAAYLT